MNRGKERAWPLVVLWSVVGLVVVAGMYFGIRYIIGQREEIAQPEEKPPVEEGETWNALLYFGSSQGDELKLLEEKRRLPRHDTVEEMVVELLTALMEGPQEEEHFPVLPGVVTLESVEVEQGIAYLNFSQLEVHTGSSGEMLALNAILLTLRSNLVEVEGYQILYQGDAVESLAGHLDCSQPITGIVGKIWSYKHEPLEMEQP